MQTLVVVSRQLIRTKPWTITDTIRLNCLDVQKHKIQPLNQKPIVIAPPRHQFSDQMNYEVSLWYQRLRVEYVQYNDHTPDENDAVMDINLDAPFNTSVREKPEKISGSKFVATWNGYAHNIVKQHQLNPLAWGHFNDKSSSALSHTVWPPWEHRPVYWYLVGVNLLDPYASHQVYAIQHLHNSAEIWELLHSLKKILSDSNMKDQIILLRYFQFSTFVVLPGKQAYNIDGRLLWMDQDSSALRLPLYVPPVFDDAWYPQEWSKHSGLYHLDGTLLTLLPQDALQVISLPHQQQIVVLCRRDLRLYQINLNDIVASNANANTNANANANAWHCLDVFDFRMQHLRFPTFEDKLDEDYCDDPWISLHYIGANHTILEHCVCGDRYPMRIWGFANNHITLLSENYKIRHNFIDCIAEVPDWNWCQQACATLAAADLLGGMVLARLVCSYISLETSCWNDP